MTPATRLRHSPSQPTTAPCFPPGRPARLRPRMRGSATSPPTASGAASGAPINPIRARAPLRRAHPMRVLGRSWMPVLRSPAPISRTPPPWTRRTAPRRLQVHVAAHVPPTARTVSRTASALRVHPTPIAAESNRVATRARSRACSASRNLDCSNPKHPQCSGQRCGRCTSDAACSARLLTPLCSLGTGEASDGEDEDSQHGKKRGHFGECVGLLNLLD